MLNVVINPVISAALSQLHHVLVWLIAPVIDQKLHFIVLLLNERDVLNK